MIWLYRILFPLLFCFLFPFYWRKIRRRGGYGGRFRDRFGRYPEHFKTKELAGCIWIQAVSVGEVNAVVPLIQKLLQSYPQYPILLTTTTSTGFAVAQARLGKLCTIALFPFDWCLFSSRAWKLFSPSVAVLMEGEIWPEHIRQAKKNNTPVVLINGRVSDRSYRRYRRFSFFTQWLWKGIDCIFASSKEDEERLRSIVPKAISIHAVGNLKFDVMEEGSFDVGQKVIKKKTLGLWEPRGMDGKEPLILLGSSTWPGEEDMLIRVWSKLNQMEKIPPVRLVLVPRHAERRNEVINELHRHAISFAVRGKGEYPVESTAVYLVDTTGELADFTSVSDVAFIGKSILPNEGGQTPIEAAAFGVPMVYGPRMTNFRSVCQSLENAGAVLRCKDRDGAIEALVHLFSDVTAREDLSGKALVWHEKHRGASARICQDLQVFLKNE